MIDKVDSKGFFILESHVVVTFVFEEVTSVNLVEFMEGAILDHVNIRKSSDEFEFTIDSSYGFHGSLWARQVRVEFQTGQALNND